MNTLIKHYTGNIMTPYSYDELHGHVVMIHLSKESRKGINIIPYSSFANDSLRVLTLVLLSA